MSTMVKLGLVVLGSILVVLLILFVMGVEVGGPGTDSNNSDVRSNSSQRLIVHSLGAPDGPDG